MPSSKLNLQGSSPLSSPLIGARLATGHAARGGLLVHSDVRGSPSSTCLSVYGALPSPLLFAARGPPLSFSRLALGPFLHLRFVWLGPSTYIFVVQGSVPVACYLAVRGSPIPPSFCRKTWPLSLSPNRLAGFTSPFHRSVVLGLPLLILLLCRAWPLPCVFAAQGSPLSPSFLRRVPRPLPLPSPRDSAHIHLLYAGLVLQLLVGARCSGLGLSYTKLWISG